MKIVLEGTEQEMISFFKGTAISIGKFVDLNTPKDDVTKKSVDEEILRDYVSPNLGRSLYC